ncbi:signal peptidase I [Nocardioides thalensis]|uniref:Signal peptidase I n=1 Tax=Nocardioides thalensis TaxID=1914755 RepID=A0A853C0R2_9ACTN|nr:signal peptidase I [Nocardioides thalensis]
MTTDASDPETPEDVAAAGEEAQEPEKKRKHMPVWQESILLLAIALGLAVVIKTLFVQAFYIPSQSMEPGLIENDRILVQKVSYWFGRDPQRGDVVVFEDPGGWLQSGDDQQPTGLANVLSKVGLYPTGGHLVKRVIGTEGDVIECCDEQGRILVNGEPVDESEYIAKAHGKCAGDFDAPAGAQPCDWTVGPVPDGKLFVMGDNRAESADSRYKLCGTEQESCTTSPWVDTELVVGRVFSLVWPQDRWDWISRPEAFADVPNDPEGAPEDSLTAE